MTFIDGSHHSNQDGM